MTRLNKERGLNLRSDSGVVYCDYRIPMNLKDKFNKTVLTPTIAWSKCCAIKKRICAKDEYSENENVEMDECNMLRDRIRHELILKMYH